MTGEDDFVALDSITAMLVLKHGKIVFETYPDERYETLRRCLRLRQNPPACALGEPSVT